MGLRGGAHGFARDISLRERVSRVEWPTIALVALVYAGWFGVGIWLWPVAPVSALLLAGVLVALHSSLVHECLHGHPTRNSAFNEALMFLPLGLVWPYRRFKKLHMQHHADERLTDPFDDPESYYKATWAHEALPGWFKAVLKINNTLAGRMLLNPLLGSFGLIAMDVKAALGGDRHVIHAWARHLAGAAVVVTIVHFIFTMPVWLYLLFPCWIGKSIISIRTYAEHQWHESPEGRTIIVERSPLAFLFLNNNLHLVHHKLPAAPWYRLPELFSERRDEWIALNNGYCFPNYLALAKAHLFKAKEPVAHPALRREK
ncbi:MAG: fatty acid desaturase [Rhizobiaceae bacterium]